MPTLSIWTPWTYDGWDCIFKYEIRWYMSGEWTIIKINPYWYVTLIHDNSLDHTFGDNYGDRFEDDEDDGNYNEDSIDDSIECDNSYGEKYRIKRIKLDETNFQKIEKIIDDNIKTLATMWWLEPEPYNVMDWNYSRIFLWGNDISIKADISNLWQYNIYWKWPKQHNVYDLLDDMWWESYEETAENMTKLMNVFFEIRDILVENWIDERYFAY